LYIAAYGGGSGYEEENTILNAYEVAGFTPAPRGMLQVEVTFTIDLDGLLSLRAVDKRALSQKITITPQDNTTSMFEMENDAQSYNFTVTEGPPGTEQFETIRHELQNEENNNGTGGELVGHAVQLEENNNGTGGEGGEEDM
jgi:molecular chaperone DnaK (HSP70)